MTSDQVATLTSSAGHPKHKGPVRKNGRFDLEADRNMPRNADLPPLRRAVEYHGNLGLATTERDPISSALRIVYRLKCNFWTINASLIMASLHTLVDVFLLAWTMFGRLQSTRIASVTVGAVLAMLFLSMVVVFLVLGGKLQRGAVNQWTGAVEEGSSANPEVNTGCSAPA